MRFGSVARLAARGCSKTTVGRIELEDAQKSGLLAAGAALVLLLTESSGKETCSAAGAPSLVGAALGAAAARALRGS